VLSDVADRREHVLVSRHGRPAAALVPIDEYEALEETAEILSDPEALAAVDAAWRSSSEARPWRWPTFAASLPSTAPAAERVARVGLARRARRGLGDFDWS